MTKSEWPYRLPANESAHSSASMAPPDRGSASQRNIGLRSRARTGERVIVGGVISKDQRNLGIHRLVVTGRVKQPAMKEQHVAWFQFDAALGADQRLAGFDVRAQE